jgi:hypothetical protein
MRVIFDILNGVCAHAMLREEASMMLTRSATGIR